ncbi:hypothetical protein PR001_g20777 [Phytophthora rubi]|uniref:Reverse transcriptase Ty1/copia-type domain-containing protein n=2 Tax=Phytophthora rubi TaxID=129364 RepID=A0A6A3JKT0_9STRA|nr:hypothetical protein PR001_g20777 [Phytophthora rubi]
MILKRDVAGRIKWYKARLVIRGFLRRMDIDYTETYAPVIRFETIRCAIIYALQRGWAILQFDVNSAFLYGDLAEDFFMEQPPGFGKDPPHYIGRVKKGIYGLKQVPRVWNRTLHKFLPKIELEHLDSDYGLYAGKVGVKQQLSAEYELTALGQVKYLLGAKVLIDRQRRHAIFCEQQYIREDNSFPPYREIAGALQYLVSASRPDIAHAVRTLSKYLSCFDTTHFTMTKHVLRYLACTENYGLVMDVPAANDAELVCYTDVDYANDPDDRKSVGGIVTFVNGSVGSRKQEINAQRITEAEYVVMERGDT